MVHLMTKRNMVNFLHAESALPDDIGSIFWEPERLFFSIKPCSRPDRENRDLMGKRQRLFLCKHYWKRCARISPPLTVENIESQRLTGFGVLEGQPHNRVHNCVGGIFTDQSGKTTDSGGFMQANLSPVDPLFFLHHANIDRLWDVWTRKQHALGYPVLPEGSDFDAWSEERFLFFVDSKGQPVSKTKAGDYATIGDFNYRYQRDRRAVSPAAAPPQRRRHSCADRALHAQVINRP